MQKLAIVFIIMCASKVMAADPIVGAWKRGTGALIFDASGKVDATLDDNASMKWKHVEGRTYRFYNGNVIEKIQLSADGKSMDLIKDEQKKAYYRVPLKTAGNPAVGRWKYKNGILSFYRDGVVLASYDKKKNRRWKQEGKKYVFIAGNGKEVALKFPDNAERMVMGDREYYRIPIPGTDKATAKNVVDQAPETTKEPLRPINIIRFFSLVSKGDVETAQAHLKQNPGLATQKDSFGYTALHKVRCKEMTELLISHKADINAKDKYMRTPLYNTIRYKDAAFALIKNGAKLNVEDKYGKTPLHKAVRLGHLDIAEEILKNGAKPKDQFTAYSIVYSAKSRDAATALFDKYGITSAKPEKKVVKVKEKKSDVKPPVEEEDPYLTKRWLRMLKKRTELKSAKFKITETKVLDKAAVLQGKKRSIQCRLTQKGWDELPLLILVSFDVTPENAEKGKKSQFRVSNLSLDVNGVQFPFIGIKIGSTDFYQGPGISYHSDKNGNFSWSKQPTAKMYFLLPENTKSCKLVFEGSVVDEAVIK